MTKGPNRSNPFQPTPILLHIPTLPPPYTLATDDKKDAPSFTLIVEKEEEPLPTQKPAPQASTSSSSQKKTRVSTSELRVLVYLYGLEMRNCKEKESDLPSPCLDMPRFSEKKPLGPRSSSRPAASSLPEDKFHFESALAAASSRHPQSGFADFPLVEDDLDSSKEYTTPRSFFHSPLAFPISQSPRFSPLLLRPPPSFDALPSYFASPKPKKEKTKAEVNAELHVQDALLALHLKEFLRTQGVCEDDLRVNFDEQSMVVEPENEKEKVVVDEPKKESLDEADEENNILDVLGEFLIEEEEHGTWVIRLRYRHRHLPLFRSPQ